MTKTPESKKGFNIFYVLPFGIFIVLCILFFFQLTSGRDNSHIPSALIGKSLPDFDLPALEGSSKPGFSTKTAGNHSLTLINVWASWCAPCRLEHPFVEALAKDKRLRVFGLNYKDKPSTALSFLHELGNPYDAIGVDESGRVGLDFGVYGVPETFLVNDQGKIVYKFIGPITDKRLKSELLPAIEKALSS